MPYIKCIVFKPSGKYYTNEMVYYSSNILSEYQIPDEVRRNRLMPDMFYVIKLIEDGIPFLIIPEDR